MAGTSAKTSSTVEIVNITPRRRWSAGEIEANDEVVSVAEVKGPEKANPAVGARSRQQNTGSGNPQGSCSQWPRKKNLSRGCPCPAWRISSETGYGRPGGVPIQRL